MKFVFHVGVFCALVILGGCASEVKYKEDADQYKAGLELVQNEIPKQKAILEFTTNTDVPATLTEQGIDNLCKPDQKNLLRGSSVSKKFRSLKTLLRQS